MGNDTRHAFRIRADASSKGSGRSTKGLIKVLIVGVAVVAGAGGCHDTNPKSELGVKRLKEICKTFKFIPRDQKGSAIRLKEGIRSGKIDPNKDLTYRSGTYNEGNYSKPAGSLSDFADLYIQHIDIFLNGSLALKMNYPEYRKRNDRFRVAAPDYVPVTCGAVENRSIYDYI